jgi:hypothetical protein
MDRPPLQYDASTDSKVRALVGKSVLILWRDFGGTDTFLPGRVTAYDSISGKHAVEYPDGSVRLYGMSRVTFRITDEGFTYKPPYSYGKEDVGEVIVRPANAARAAAAANDAGAGGGTAGDGGAAAASADVAATSAESAK